MVKTYKFGHKMQKKSWDLSKIEQEKENKKAVFFLLAVMFLMILAAILMWFIRKTLS